MILSVFAELESRRAWRSPAGVMVRQVLVISASLLLIASLPVHAEDPLWGENASTLGKGFVTATTRAGVRSTRPFRHHGSAVELTMEETTGALVVEYGLQPDLDARLCVPYFSQSMTEEFGGQKVQHEAQGMGEMLVGAKWRFWQSVGDQRKDELAAFADVKLPTGDSDLRGADGLILPPHLQPNSGNLGATIGLAANRHQSRGGHWASAMLTAESASDRYQRGPMLEMHASSGVRMRPLKRPNQIDWMGIVGLHYYMMGKDREGGRRVADSGGTVLSAEFSLLGSRRTHGLRLGVLVPLHTNLGLSNAPPRHEIMASVRGSF
jgi:hypothetical protein